MAAGQKGGQHEKVLELTEAARNRIVEIFVAQDVQGPRALRIAIEGRGPNGFQYAMGIEDGPPDPTDTVQDEGHFRVFIDAASAKKLRRSIVDFEPALMGGGFRIHNPNSIWDDPVAAGIQKLIDTEINPGVASHGGFVQLIDVKENRVYVQLGGGCQGCGMANVTLRQGIEVMIKRAFPQITDVIDTTDHAGGTNPYFQPAKGPQAGQSPLYQPAKG